MPTEIAEKPVDSPRIWAVRNATENAKDIQIKGPNGAVFIGPMAKADNEHFIEKSKHEAAEEK